MKNTASSPRAMSAPRLYETVYYLLRSLRVKKSAKILDAGAGSGRFTQMLREKGYKVCACDVNPEQFMVQGLTCTKADLNQVLPYSQHSFEVVVSIETIEHLEDPWTFCREVYRVLVPGGNFIVTTPNLTHISSRLFYLLFGKFIAFWSKRYMLSNWHISPVFTWQLTFILEHTGFSVVKKTYNEGKLFPIYKPFIKNGTLYFGSPVSLNYLPRIDLFGENLVVVATKL